MFSCRLAAEGTPLNRTGVGQILTEEGFGRLLRGPAAEASTCPATPGRDTNLPRAGVIDFAAFPARADTRLAGLLLTVPDLVTLDLRMPGLSGIEVLREIKKLKNDSEVIIITGYGTLANAQEAIRYGAVDFISKPFNVADVIGIISKSFERRKLNLNIRNLSQDIKAINTLRDNQKEESKVH